MAVPRNKISKSRRDKRSSHSAKKPKTTSTCANCSATKLPHRICPSCGYYAKRELIKKQGSDES